MTVASPVCYARYMSVSDQELLHHLSRMPLVDTAELAMITGEGHVAIHRGLSGLLADGIVGRVSHGTAPLPSSRRYYLTAQGIREAAGVLGFETPSDYVRAYPVSREWLTLLVRRMDAEASIYRLAASLSPGTDGLRTQVEFHPRGRFDAVITLHNGRSFGVVRLVTCPSAEATRPQPDAPVPSRIDRCGFQMTLASLFGAWRARGLNRLLECRRLLISPQL